MASLQLIRNNVDVLKCFGAIVQPAIGGNQSVKCIDDEGEICLVKDVGQLLHLLHIQHPVGQHIRRICRGFTEQHHTGAATLLFYIRSFSRVAVNMLEQGFARRYVDRLIHAALEECIQHVTKETIKINTSGAETCNTSFLMRSKNNKSTDKGWLLNQTVCSTKKSMIKETSCPQKRAIANKSLIKSSDKLKRKDEASCKLFVKPCYGEDDSSSKEIDQHQKQCVNDKAEMKPKLAELHFDSPRTNTGQLIHHNVSERTDVSESCKANVPVVELKMTMSHNSNEKVCAEDTEWFFDSGASDLGHLSSEVIPENDLQNGLSAQQLKEKWDKELIEDIQDLKEAIEKDLTIVHERRQRMNKRLSEYIKSSPKPDNDDEFDNCFEDLKSNAKVPHTDKMVMERPCTEASRNIQRIECFQKKDKKLTCHKDSQSKDKAGLAHIKTGYVNAEMCSSEKNVRSVSSATCDSTETANKFQSKKACSLHHTEDRSDIPNKTLDANKLRIRSRHLNNAKIGTETKTVVSLNKSTVVNNSQSSCTHKREVVETRDTFHSNEQEDQSRQKHGEENHHNALYSRRRNHGDDSSSESTKHSEQFPKQNHSNSGNKSTSSVKKQNIDLKSINNLLVDVGISGDISRIGVANICKSSRHVGKTNLEETRSDRNGERTLQPSKEIVEQTQPKGGKFNDSGQSNINKESDQLENESLNDETRKSEDKKQSWLYKLISGLCPYTGMGIIEIVCQIISYHLGEMNDIRVFSDKFNINMISCHREVGVLSRKPELVEGLIVKTTCDNMELVEQWKQKPCRLLIVNGDIQPNYHHKGYKKVDNTTAVRRVETMPGHVTPNDIWLKDIRHVLKEFSVCVVLARGLVCDELKLLSQQDQLVIIEMVPYRTLEILADSCQADMVTYLTLASEMNVCCDVTLLPLSPDWMDKGELERYDLILKVSTACLQTVLLSELTDQIASLKEQELWDCLFMVVSSLKTGFVLPGGAKTEINCMKFCEKRAEDERKKKGSEKYLSIVFEELATAFKEYVDTYLANTGFDQRVLAAHTGTVINQLESCDNQEDLFESQSMDCEHSLEQSNQSVNYDISQNQSADCDNSYDNIYDWNINVYFDDYATKVEAWRTALDTVFEILSIDSFVRTGLTDENFDKGVYSSL